jgi:hypothetical protein
MTLVNTNQYLVVNEGFGRDFSHLPEERNIADDGAREANPPLVPITNEPRAPHQNYF